MEIVARAAELLQLTVGADAWKVTLTLGPRTTAVLAGIALVRGAMGA